LRTALPVARVLSRLSVFIFSKCCADERELLLFFLTGFKVSASFAPLIPKAKAQIGNGKSLRKPNIWPWRLSFR
jgi:hypothetical protein